MFLKKILLCSVLSFSLITFSNAGHEDSVSFTEESKEKKTFYAQDYNGPDIESLTKHIQQKLTSDTEFTLTLSSVTSAPWRLWNRLRSPYKYNGRGTCNFINEENVRTAFKNGESHDVYVERIVKSYYEAVAGLFAKSPSIKESTLDFTRLEFDGNPLQKNDGPYFETVIDSLPNALDNLWVMIWNADQVNYIKDHLLPLKNVPLLLKCL